MALNGTSVAVAGAGVGGLAAAIALARRGAEVTVLEQAPALGEVGAGLQIGPNGVAALEALGVRTAAEAVATEPEAVELRDGGDARLVARLPLGPGCRARYGRPYWQMHRADLLGALAEAARAAGVALRTGVRVERVEARPGGVRLALAGGETLETDLAIGADGLRSALRGALFDGAPPRFAGAVAWRGLVPAERLPAGLLAPGATVFMGPGRHLVAYPLRQGRLWNFVAVEERADWAEEGWSAPADPAGLRAAFAGWAEPARRLLAAVEETFLWGLFVHPPLRSWTRGRIALLGDACHPMTPFLAQGACMALEDAWVLAEALDAAEDPQAGLKAYEARRIGRTTRVQRAAAGAGRVYHLRQPLIRRAAHLGLAAASRVAPGLLLGRFDWLYGVDVAGATASDK
jgi:salicylate hydroxylase